MSRYLHETKRNWRPSRARRNFSSTIIVRQICASKSSRSTWGALWRCWILRAFCHAWAGLWCEVRLTFVNISVQWTRFHMDHMNANVKKKQMIDRLPANLQRGLVRHLYSGLEWPRTTSGPYVVETKIALSVAKLQLAYAQAICRVYQCLTNPKSVTLNPKHETNPCACAGEVSRVKVFNSDSRACAGGNFCYTYASHVLSYIKSLDSLNHTP